MRARGRPAPDDVAPRSHPVARRELGRGDGHELGYERELGHEQVSEIQRGRLLAAMVEMVAERGADNLTVTHVVTRSGVSRRTFYEHFADRDECLATAFEDAVRRIEARVIHAYERQSSWPAKLRAGLAELLESLDRERNVAQLLVVASLGAGPIVLSARERAFDRIVAALDADGKSAAGRVDPPPLAAEAVVGAVLSIVHRRVLLCGPVEAPFAPMLGERLPAVVESPGGRSPATVESPSLLELANTLMGIIVLPYLGAAAARRELDRPAPLRSETERRSYNPLKGLGMRLTYRTVRVLMAVGAQPGVSNRRIADAAGVSDQGQISKLLARLDNLGLVENGGFGQLKGESNSWYLTTRGREVEQAIRRQTERS